MFGSRFMAWVLRVTAVPPGIYTPEISTPSGGTSRSIGSMKKGVIRKDSLKHASMYRSLLAEVQDGGEERFAVSISVFSFAKTR